MAEERKPLMLTGIQPSGQLMIGNYIGAIKNWVELQATHEPFFCLADLHAITVPQDPAELRWRSLEFIALLAACGVDTEKSTIFLQSHVPAHTQLLWVLNCIAPMGDLQRMTQFKEKAAGRTVGVHVGLFDYPVLMAADILLYGADVVPVGEDQTQHMEFTRRLARKFNATYGEVFRIPKPYLPRTGARLMALQAPAAKMSKSDRNEDNYVALLDPPEVVRRKIESAVTDSGSEVRSGPGKPGITNLMTLFSAVTGGSLESVQNRYHGKGYAEFKRDLSERVIDFLGPIQRRYRSIAADQGLLAEVLQTGARIARERSEETLSRVHRAVGLVALEEGQRRFPRLDPFSRGQPADRPAFPAARPALKKRGATETKEKGAVGTSAAGEAERDAEYPADGCVCCC